jgi:transcriptional regulator with XRE-family HTH domain
LIKLPKEVMDMAEQYREEFKQLGLKIAYYRKLKGYTQEALAEKVNLSTAFIGHVEAPNVKKSVSLGTLFAIAEALDVPVHKFLKFDD